MGRKVMYCSAWATLNGSGVCGPLSPTITEATTTARTAARYTNNSVALIEALVSVRMGRDCSAVRLRRVFSVVDMSSPWLVEGPSLRGFLCPAAGGHLEDHPAGLPP